MASIVGKKLGGKTYYYLVESARVGGKPRIVSQRYLGPAEEIVARLSGAGPGEPDRTRHLAFGDLAAVWSMLDRMRVAEIVDEVVGRRPAGEGPLLGVGSPPVLGCHGLDLRRAAAADRAARRRMGGGGVPGRPDR